MSLLEEVCASVLDRAVVDSLELVCPFWQEPLRLVQGFMDLSLGYGDGTYAPFLAVPMGLVIPRRGAGGGQKITFAVDNVNGHAQRLIDVAIANNAEVACTFRRYVEGEYYGPAERPFVATLRGGDFKGYSVQIEAGFNNILDWKYPRDTYDLDYAPDLAYV